MKEGKLRSLLKSISFRIIAFLITFFVSFVITGKIIFATSIGLIDSLIKIFIYYFHERVWNKIKI